ncbi:MAG: AI-2E family transporter [Elusimicrobia bacterium]|nr:AI-2E family transporter [Elusimicrobiota bacterium]
MSAHRKASYILFAVLFAIAIGFHLGPALLAGLFAYSILDLAHRLFARRMGVLKARSLAVLMFFVVAAGMSWMLAHFLRQSLSAFPDMLSTAMPKINDITQRWGVDLPFENMQELRSVLVDAVKKNAGGITKASGLLTNRFFHVLLALIAAILAFLSPKQEPDCRTQYGALRAEFDERVRRFLESFERVLGAQVAISSINTALTAAFLIFLGFPYAAFLIPATFLLGILPIIGNILSNTIICCAALTMTLKHAVLALIFLVVIHKGEYFLNSRIIGTSIRVPMWQTLLGILIGEAVMGVSGIILAPAIIHYVRGELEAVPTGEAGPRPSG